MKTKMKKTMNISYTAFALFAFACLALAPTARAVSPPPDGGYPNANTAKGEDALFSLTTGSGNTATGFQALFSNTTGFWNTAVSGAALNSNTTGNENTACGRLALESNATGDFNTAVGSQALRFNSGTGNTAIGHATLGGPEIITTGSNNTACGDVALLSNTTGYENTALEPRLSLPTPKPFETQPSVTRRFLTTRLDKATPLLVGTRCIATPNRGITLPSVLTPFRPAQVAKTRHWVLALAPI